MQFDWDRIEHSVTRAIEAGSIGTPRALRLTLHVAGDEESGSRLSSAVMNAVAGWYGGEPVSAWSGEGQPNVNVSLARWSNGCSALVSISSAATGFTGGDFALLGSKGTVYHRFGGGGE